jgi:hypothetical protein
MTTLILWGKHPSHDSVWLKLAKNPSQKYIEGRKREGWILATLKQGDSPLTDRDQLQAQVEAYRTAHKEQACTGETLRQTLTRLRRAADGFEAQAKLLREALWGLLKLHEPTDRLARRRNEYEQARQALTSTEPKQ